MRCPRCGNENSDENRFCGMCGAKMLPAPAVVASTPVTVSASPQASSARPTPPLSPAAPLSRPQAITPTRPSPPPMEEHEAFINGPSFLGLNDPAPRKRASLSSDPHSSSNNLDYLLDDEEEPRRGGAGKFVLILLALALAVGFGYLRWKNQSLPTWLHLSPSKPPATAQDSDPTDTTPPATTPSTTPATTPAATPSATTPAAPAATSPAASQPAAEATQQAADSSATTSSPSGTPAAPPAPPASTSPAAGDAADSSDASNSSSDAASKPNEPATKAPAEEPAAAAATATQPAPTPKPKRAVSERAPKPAAGVASTASGDSVAEAQKYIYARGASQDCERGMRLLKPAAAQANPKAMIEMGALYSAGLCTPHDLPTAYRWFAMALRKDPDNQAVQADLQKLWSEMTQPERQLAIKLSQ